MAGKDADILEERRLLVWTIVWPIALVVTVISGVAAAIGLPLAWLLSRLSRDVNSGPL
jgi:hypothetical protein